MEKNLCLLSLLSTTLSFLLYVLGTVLNYTLAKMTLWPEWPFGQRHFGQRTLGRRDSLASVTLAGETLSRDTFFLLPLGYQRVNKNTLGDHREKCEKNNRQFSEKNYGPPPVEFLFIHWYPKGGKKNWPKWHWLNCLAKG